MKKQKLLTDVLANVISRMTFPVEYKSFSSDATTITLEGICDIRHIQPGRTVTVNAVDYKVLAYAAVGTQFTITLEKVAQPDPPTSGTFELYKPKFVHGTPMQQETELKNIQDQREKNLLIYCMEPYKSRIDNNWDSNIHSRTPVTLCFLTEADLNLVTEDIQYNAVKPMYNLAQDFIAQAIESGLFYTEEINPDVTFHTKFGINVKDSGTKQMSFTEHLSGVSMDIRLDLYKEDSCCQDTNFLLTSSGMFLQVD